VSTNSKYHQLLAVRNTLNALLAEMEKEAVSVQPKRKKNNDFEEYEKALITGKRVAKPDHLKQKTA